MINPTTEQVEVIKTHLNNMINYTKINKSRKEVQYYGKRNNTYLLTAEKIKIQREIALCNEWLEEYETKRIEYRLRENFEADLRLFLVKQFIYENNNYICQK